MDESQSVYYGFLLLALSLLIVMAGLVYFQGLYEFELDCDRIKDAKLPYVTEDRSFGFEECFVLLETGGRVKASEIDFTKLID